MSGHNPHGHLSQPNSSWNPLQIPSYIPRQPQLAHMSNERPLVRSPLTWHTPTPPEALYSFISANHKNLELNPLLPSFVRGTAPFGSVDLTIQSARNSTTPSPRNLTSPPPEFVHNKGIPCNVSQTSLPNSISPNPGVIQTTGSVRDKYASSNGNNGELPTTGGLFVRDARQINNELVKLANREAMEDVSQPVELVKESLFHATKGLPVPMSPKRLSPTRPPSIPSSTPESPPPENQGISLATINSVGEVVNNHVGSVLPQKPAVETISTEHSPVCSAIPSPSNTTSNEDSVDSSASKTRRKRKPNKTVRVSNDSDESLPSNNEIDACPPKIPDVVIPPAPPEFEKEPIPVKTEVEPVSNGNEAVQPIPEEEAEVAQEKIIEPISSVPESIEIVQNTENGTSEQIASQDEEKDISSKCPQNEPPSVIVDNTANRSNSTEEKSEEAIEIPVKEIAPEEPKEQVDTNCLDSPMKRSKRKGDSDDIETIDKIAAMIANSNDAEDEIPVSNVKNTEQAGAQNDKNQAQNISSSSNKINDLTEILTAPVSESKPSHETVEKNKENSFEEVENKLEEMFAGIEDERPLCVDPPPPETCEGTTSQEGACDLGLELPLPDKNENISEQKQMSMPQKRTHSNKHDQVPPKKKRRITKKPLSNSKSVKSKTKHAIKSTLTEKNLKDKVKDEPTVDVRYKGPYVQVKPDGSINVVNAPITEEDSEKHNKVKKSIHNHTNSERSKIRGLHVSTLSTKYDADTTDASWMCVFCKKGPHKMGLGDLFGPYIVTTSCEDFELSQIDPSEDEFVSKRMKADMFQKQPNTLPVVPSSHAAANLFPSSLKKKRKNSDSPNVTKSQQQTTSKEILFGMSKVSDTSYEVWVHEDCAVWAPGVYLVGARIIGLEPAVWNSTRYKCSICSSNGAIICCLQRGCSEKAHIPCARTQNWAVDESDFKSFCGCHSDSGS